MERRKMLLVVTTLGIICLAGVVQGQSATNTSACFGRKDCTSSMLLQCASDQHVFITKMLYGFKPGESTCSISPTCNKCCQPGVDDCFRDFTYNSVSVYDACWNTTNCTTLASLENLACGGTSSSHFSVLEYVCLPAGLVTEFHTNISITAPAVAVYYNSINKNSYPVVRGDNQTWHCQVDTADCVQRQIDVILVKESYPGSTSRCSRVGWSEGPYLPCVPTFRYKRVIATTPFYVSVLVDKSNRYPTGWAVVKAPDGSNIVVTCGYTPDATQDKGICPGSSTNTPTTSATDMRTDATTTLSKTLDTETTRTSKKATTSRPSSSAVTSSAATARPSQGSVVQGQNARNTSACYGRTDCNSSMLLQCGADQHVFITRMLYGVRRETSACSTMPSCNTCCQPDISDCFREYTKDAELVYDDCWDRQRCTTPALQAGLTCDGFKLSTFSVIEYICLQAGLVTEFQTSTSITAPVMAVHYDSFKTSSYPVVRGDNQTWYCQVDTADCVQRQADVILVKESYIVSTSRCSSVGWSGGPFLPCVPHFQYKRVTATTPFDVSVMVDNSNRFPSGWALVRALDASNLTVTCGFTSDPSAINPDSATSSRDVTVAKVTTPKSMSSSSATGTERPMEEGSKGVPLGVTVTGWVLAAVLGALFIISVIFLIRSRRRGTSSASTAMRDNTQVRVASAEVIHMEQTSHRSQSPEHMEQTSHRSQSPEHMDASSSRPAEYANAASSHTDRATVYVNAESRHDNQQEYSSLDWSRDQANPYTGLRKT